MFEGYADHPEWTAAAFTRDGWFRTGDLGVMDESGFVRITGRVRDVINRGGEKIPVAEMEQLLSDHPAVADIGIVAMPDARLGERACAFVVLRSGALLRFPANAVLSRRVSSRQDITGPSDSKSSPDSLARPRAKCKSTSCASAPRRCGRAERVKERKSLEAATDRAGAFDESSFASLKEEISEYVAGPAEVWARRIEAERQVPAELWEELRRRGYLSLAAPAVYGGRGIPFTRYLELVELFSMSHASIRMIVHVVNGTWRAMDRFATPEQRASFVCAFGQGRDQDRLYADRTHCGEPAPTCAAASCGRTTRIYPERREAPDQAVRYDLRLLAAFRARRGNARSGRNRGIARRPPRTGRDRRRDGRVRMGVRGTDHAALSLRSRAGSGS